MLVHPARYGRDARCAPGAVCVRSRFTQHAGRHSAYLIGVAHLHLLVSKASLHSFCGRRPRQTRRTLAHSGIHVPRVMYGSKSSSCHCSAPTPLSVAAGVLPRLVFSAKWHGAPHIGSWGARLRACASVSDERHAGAGAGRAEVRARVRTPRHARTAAHTHLYTLALTSF